MISISRFMIFFLATGLLAYAVCRVFNLSAIIAMIFALGGGAIGSVTGE